jgi:DNA-directed RNA polymerase II subunit RPB7
MFFLYNMERRVTLHPSYFGRNMHELVTSKLLKDVEGTCAGSYYIISIMDTFDISEGRILPGNGLAEFTVGYRAVVWRPFKGETVRLGKQNLRKAASRRGLRGWRAKTILSNV